MVKLPFCYPDMTVWKDIFMNFLASKLEHFNILLIFLKNSGTFFMLKNHCTHTTTVVLKP